MAVFRGVDIVDAIPSPGAERGTERGMEILRPMSLFPSGNLTWDSHRGAGGGRLDRSR